MSTLALLETLADYILNDHREQIDFFENPSETHIYALAHKVFYSPEATVNMIREAKEQRQIAITNQKLEQITVEDLIKQGK